MALADQPTPREFAVYTSSAGTKLLQAQLEHFNGRSDISDVYCHVQVNNDDAIRYGKSSHSVYTDALSSARFYTKHGFKKIGENPNYYKVEPRACVVLSKVSFGWTPCSFHSQDFPVCARR